MTFTLLSAVAVAVASAPLQSPSPPPEGGLWQTGMMIGIAVLFFYFILWRPEQRRRKEVEAQRSSMKPGDRVVAMGVVGTVHKVEEQTVIVRTSADGTKIEFLKAAISEVIAGDATGK